MIDKIVGKVPLVISDSAATLIWVVSLLVMFSTILFIVVHLKSLTVMQRRTLWMLCLMSATGTVIPFQLEAVYFTILAFLFFVVSLHKSYLQNNNKRFA